MKLSSETKELLTRSRRLLSRSWVSGYLFRRNPDNNKPEYCLMGGILRSAGVKPVQMEEPTFDIFGKVQKSKVQKIIQWSQFPSEAKVAMQALAVTILEEDEGLQYDYLGYKYGYTEPYGDDSMTAAEFIKRYPEETPNIIAEYNDASYRSKADIKRVLTKTVDSD